MKINKLITSLLAAVTLLLVSMPSKVQASHFAAGEIYLTYIGEGADGCSNTSEYKYLLHVNIYRACEGGAAAPNSVQIQWGSENAGFNGPTINMGNPIRDTLNDLCEVFVPQNSCIFPANKETFPAYIRHTFIDTLILPSAQTDWKFSYQSCCRNGGILNGSSNGSFYIETMLNNLTKYNNSTPRFLVDPLPYICAGQPANYLNGPYDPNSDSMFTTVTEPLGNATTPIPYTAPYSINDPMGAVAGTQFNFDNTTGSAKFTPALQGKYVMAFKCAEYERGTGIPLGYVLRDVQVSVFPCSAPPPAVDTVPPQINNASLVKIKGENAILTCPGSAIDFSVSTESQNPNSNIYLQANIGSLPGSNFTTSGDGTNKVTGEFTWTPTVNDIGEHTLIITGKDSTCSGTSFAIVLKNYTVLQIKVVPGLDAGPDLPICEVGGDSVQIFVYNADVIDDMPIQWSVVGGGPVKGLSDLTIHNPKAKPSENTEYIISSPVLTGNCKSRDTVRVFIDKTNEVNITPKNPNKEEDALVMCRPGYLQLEALLKGRPPKNNVACGTGSPTLCNNPDSVGIYGSAVYGDLAYDTTSIAAPVMFNTLRTNKQQYLIRRNDMKRQDIYSSTIRSMAFETIGTSSPNYEYSNFKIFIKCTDKDELAKADGFENFGLTQVYSASTITLEDGVHNFVFSSPYSWDTTKNLIIVMCYSNNASVETGCGVSSTPPRIPYVPTTYISAMKVVGADENVGSVCGVINSNEIVDVQARPLIYFTFCEADPLPFDIKWTNSEYLSDTTILQPLAYVPKSTKFVIRTIGRSNCVMSDTLEVYVPDNDYSIEPADTALCLGDEAPFLIRGGFFFKWYEYRDGQYLPPAGVTEPTKGATFIGPDKTTDYRIVVSDSVWCYDTISAKVEILPLPDVKVLNEDDTTVKYGQRFQLLASGAKYYNWSPVSSLNNPNISYPIARPTEDTKYIVGGIGSNGCRSFDTLHVIVDKSDNLFVPSGFSPNGDGKNDYFRVTNLSFQRIMEFRVFNRQGLEVFSTNDVNMGWDGTYNGKPQDIGTYSYLIRVAYPDGFVETYTGKTTLIR